MRSITMMLGLALCSTTALGIDRASVNVPFSFGSNGESFPAGRYEVKLNEDRNHITISNREMPTKRLSWVVSPTEVRPNDVALDIQFDQVGTVHELHAVRLGSYEATALHPHSNLPASTQVLSGAGK
jgi:hypothetical protein